MLSIRSLSASTILLVAIILSGLCITNTMAQPNENGYQVNSWSQSNPVYSDANTLKVSSEYASDRLIVKYNPESVSSKAQMMSIQSAANEEAGAYVIEDLSSEGVPGMQVVQVSGSSLEDAMRTYESDPDVQYVEPDYKITVNPIENVGETASVRSLQAAGSSYPNDPGYPDQWGLYNTANPGADISAPLAWGGTTGSSGVIVALIDTGVDYTHPDLAANIWTNPVEVINGIDDDNNGYIDDVRGWNFVSKTNDPMDDNGHGTHCAGTIAAVGNNGIGIAGVTWSTKIMPLKFLDSKGSGYTSDAISAILYANKMGVPIISNSWNGNGNSQSLKEAIDASGAVIICAAGNKGENSDINPQYPAAFTSDNIISVAGSTPQDTLASFSNYGPVSVDLAAPGDKIYSTSNSGGYSYLSGTSMATPYVSGVAALLKAQSPSISTAQIKGKILNNCDVLQSFAGKVSTGGRLNAAKALGINNPTPTPTPTPTFTQPPTWFPTPKPTPTFTWPPTWFPTPKPTPTQFPTYPPTFPVTWTPVPTRTPDKMCGIYKTDTQSGSLKTGQARVYGYYIPSDGRSKIEWTLSTYGSRYFDMYVCKDCNPKNSACSAQYSSIGPDPSITIDRPVTGSIYYVMIYARKGSGPYNLNMKSYKCQGDTPIIVASTRGTGRDITLPIVEFVE